MPHFLTLDEVSDLTILELLEGAERERDRHYHLRDPKVMTTLFFEPSTRTRISFEIAMQRIGGKVASAPNPECLSIAKGESLADTIETIAHMSDVVVVRSAQPLSQWFNGSQLPAVVINAGDGANNHPTQALLDLYTIWLHHGCSNTIFEPNLKLAHGIVGDLGSSRAIRSYVQLMSRYHHEIHAFDSTGQCRKIRDLPDSVEIAYYDKLHDFERSIYGFDVLYLNRTQKERHEEDPGNGFFQLTAEHLASLKSTAIVLNPGPRREELPHPLCRHPAVKMINQVENGMYIRMALLRKLFLKNPMDTLNKT